MPFVISTAMPTKALDSFLYFEALYLTVNIAGTLTSVEESFSKGGLRPFAFNGEHEIYETSVPFCGVSTSDSDCPPFTLN